MILKDYLNLTHLEDKIYEEQKILNSTARFIFDLKWDEHTSPYLFKLHFLPITFRIEFKLCIIAFKIVHGKAPMYLEKFFQFYRPTTDLRLRTGVGRDELMLEVVNDTFGTKNIQEKWNRLPLSLRLVNDYTGFKRKLKTS